MQEISLKNLKRLLPAEQVDESLFNSAGREDIGGGLKFKDVCDAYDRQMDRLEYENGEYGTKRLRPQAYNYMNAQVLSKHCPPIVLVGKGSSRAAYACIGGKCIKMAMNAAGVAQNRQEWKHTAKHWLKRQYECFVHTYGSNGNDYGVILAECCSPCKTSDQLAEALGVSDLDVFKNIVVEVSKAEKCDVAAATANLKKLSDSSGRKYKYFKQSWSDTFDEAFRFLSDMVSKEFSKMSPGEQSLAELFRFWQKNGVRELLPGDVQMYRNWGFAIRNGQIAPVMLDAGFSKSISMRYY
jgi:hypothetical protein